MIYPLLTRLGVAALILAGFVRTTLGGAPIQFRTNVAAGIKEAQAKRLPIFLYIPPTGQIRRGDWNNIHKRVQRDPAIVQCAETRFVPIRAQRGNQNEALFERLGVKPGQGFKAVIATPELNRILEIDFRTLGDERKTRAKLTEGFRRYRSLRYDRDIRPVLTAPAPKTQPLIDALEDVERYLILQADDDVIALLDRELSGAARLKVFGTLAALSTSQSAQALLARADSESAAAKALFNCARS